MNLDSLFHLNVDQMKGMKESGKERENGGSWFGKQTRNESKKRIVS